MTDYISPDEFKDFVKDNTTLDQATVATAITVASRTVEQMTNRPTNGYAAAGTTTAHYFSPHSSWELCLEDDGIQWEFGTTTGLTVKTDNDGDGVYETTLTLNTHFFCEPINQARYGVSGWPYDSIHLLTASSTAWPTRRPGYRPPVEVTANWGWTTTPEPVKFAVRLAANRYYGRGDSRYGTSGFDASGFQMRIRTDPDILALLSPFTPASRSVA
jgi:hypothetical protein